MKSILAILFVQLSVITAKADWEDEVKQQFGIFARAMQEAKYAPLFEIFTTGSSNIYRQVMLDQYAAQERRGSLCSPPDKDGKPLSLKQIRGMRNSKFWEVHIAQFRALEEEIARKLIEAHGELGPPTFTAGKIFRDGDRVFILAERTFKIKSDIKMPYQVIEFVLEDGHWKMEVPRDMLWEAQKDAAELDKK